MSKGNRFTEEFKLDAVKQVVERGFGVADVSKRLGVSSHSLYAWINKYGLPAEQRLAHDDQVAKVKRLEAELRRVTEERDILKKAAAYFAKESG
jgi:transposase